MKIFTSQERTVVIILSSLFILGMVVKTAKDYFYTGTDQITLIGINEGVVDFYAGLGKKDIEFSGKVDINTAGIEELKSLPGIGSKTLEKLLPNIRIQ